MMKLTNDIIISFKEYLIDNDKCVYTIDKYIRDVMKFKEYVCDCEIEKETAMKTAYATTAVMLCPRLKTVNAFVIKRDLPDLFIK